MDTEPGNTDPVFSDEEYQSGNQSLSLDTVVDLAANVLRSKLKDLVGSNSLERWLAQARSEKEGKRLIICLAFDLCAEPESARAIAEVLARIDLSVSDAVVAFGKAVALTNAAAHVSSGLSSEKPDAEGSLYVRVLRLEAFVTYYLQLDIPYTLSASDLDEVRTIYFSERATRSLADVRKPWCGRNKGVVWVCSLSEFQEALSASDAATILNDALGLGLPARLAGTSTELVAVRYPPGVPTDCGQPRTLHADWESLNFFMPYWKQDNWGRTQSCSGTRTPMKERIHKGYPHGLSSAYHGIHIGKIQQAVQDRDKLYQKTGDIFLEMYGRIENSQ